MAIRIIEIHPAAEPDQLNTEWLIIENTGERPFSTRGCSLFVHKRSSADGARKKKGKKTSTRPKKTNLGTMDPGFTLAPGDKIRVATGNPGRKAHGKSPDDDLRVYNLFLNESILRGPGSILTLTLRSLPVTKVMYDPEAEGGVAPSDK